MLQNSYKYGKIIHYILLRGYYIISAATEVLLKRYFMPFFRHISSFLRKKSYYTAVFVHKMMFKYKKSCKLIDFLDKIDYYIIIT